MRQETETRWPNNGVWHLLTRKNETEDFSPTVEDDEIDRMQGKRRHSSPNNLEDFFGPGGDAPDEK